jgi:hypothetical protein
MPRRSSRRSISTNFATRPLLDRGGMRRTWRRGRENVAKRYLAHVAAYNLGLRRAGTPRTAAGPRLLWLTTGDHLLFVLIMSAQTGSSAPPQPPRLRSSSSHPTTALYQRAADLARLHARLRCHGYPPCAHRLQQPKGNVDTECFVPTLKEELVWLRERTSPGAFLAALDRWLADYNAPYHRGLGSGPA